MQSAGLWKKLRKNIRRRRKKRWSSPTHSSTAVSAYNSRYMQCWHYRKREIWVNQKNNNSPTDMCSQPRTAHTGGPLAVILRYSSINITWIKWTSFLTNSLPVTNLYQQKKYCIGGLKGQEFLIFFICYIQLFFYLFWLRYSKMGGFSSYSQ